MKFTISKSEFQKALSRVQSVVEKRNTMPILANAYLEVIGGDEPLLRLAATDLEVGIRSAHPCEVTEAGAVTASAKKLHEIVRELPDEPIHIEVGANAYLSIRCGRAEFTLAGSAADEYPTIPEIVPNRLVPLSGVVLGEMIERTLYAASTDETRYNLNGVHLERLPESEKIRMVATDGHRLAYVDRSIPGELEALAAGIILPRKGLSELKRLVDEDGSDEVELGFEGNSALARCSGVTLVIRLIEGEFPNYSQVIPQDVNRHLVVDTGTLMHALRRVALLSAERSRAVKLELSDGHLALSSSNPDLGDAREELDVDYSGEPLTIAFNARYLTEALAGCGSKEVRISLKDPLSPARVTPSGDEDTLAVVMPMRA